MIEIQGSHSTVGPLCGFVCAIIAFAYPLLCERWARRTALRRSSAAAKAKVQR
jgi:hypothetical protein